MGEAFLVSHGYKPIVYKSTGKSTNYSTQQSLSVSMYNVNLGLTGIFKVVFNCYGTCNSTYWNNIYQKASLQLGDSYYYSDEYNPMSGNAKQVSISMELVFVVYTLSKDNININWVGGYSGDGVTNSINLTSDLIVYSLG